MPTAVAVNGSPRKSKGNTAVVLNAFLEGLSDGGITTELRYASRLDIKPCICGDMRCWYQTPGECYIRDDMDDLLETIKKAETFILATPVYIPLPGAMQNFLNRLCPLMNPALEFRDGRTRARVRDGFAMRRIVLVSTGDWWEKGNSDVVTHIAKELAADLSIEFAGAVVRPHASVMRPGGQITPDGQAVLEAVRRAGSELATTGEMQPATLAQVSRPLVPEEALRKMYNDLNPA